MDKKHLICCPKPFKYRLRLAKYDGYQNAILFVKCKKTDLICKNNKTYETTYRVPFIVSQQRINKKFIMMNNEIIQLRAELLKRSKDYLLGK